MAKHFSLKKHKDKIENPDAVIVGGFICKNCDKVYKSNPGLWAHNKKCKPAVVASEVPEPDLREEINNLKVMIIESAKNQQPTTINNYNRVNNSINNYINVFLNDKCHNTCDIRKFIAGIDFSKQNFQNI